MKKFLVTYHAPAETLQAMTNRSPEDMQKGMEAWMQWSQKCGSNLVDMGMPLYNSQSIKSDGTTAGSDKQFCGYSILQAENMEAAKALMEGHPHISGWNPDASVEVHETMQLPGM